MTDEGQAISGRVSSSASSRRIVWGQVGGSSSIDHCIVHVALKSNLSKSFYYYIKDKKRNKQIVTPLDFFTIVPVSARLEKETKRTSSRPFSRPNSGCFPCSVLVTLKHNIYCPFLGEGYLTELCYGRQSVVISMRYPTETN